MKTSVLTVGAQLFGQTAAHYMWSHLLVNGTETEEFRYVRDVAPDPSYSSAIPGLSKIAPQLDITTTNITCGRNAFSSASSTETATVIAGSEVGFRLSEAYASVDPPSHVFHPGPGQAYLSRPPDGVELEQYEGTEGDWFKIDVAGPMDDANWTLLNKREYNFTVPVTTPPGSYLLRIEQFLPTAIYNNSQWYVNCAHVNIVGSGGGAPTEFARFPGTYKPDDPGILITEEMAMYPPDATNLLSYVPPGPAVWKG
ncbi:lytic polysaccharide monooxygenase [Xylariomycetidae sp. FL2044]|nr:lytic polysaccharide monooxygenase [Xylariomycetidae sp. FL2044]